MNHDAKINALLTQLRAALVAREQARIEATVEAQLSGLTRGLGKMGNGVVSGRATAVSAAPAKKKRRGWSAAAKAAAAKRMRAYWAAKRTKGGKRGKAKAEPKGVAQP